MSRLSTLCLAISLLSGSLCGQSFINPVFASQDPYLVLWQGNYYYSESAHDKIYLRKSPTLSGLKSHAPVPVWTSTLRGWDGHANVWAPEIHLLNGRWYIYFAADYKTDGRHRLYVLEGGSDPMDPYKVPDTGFPDGELGESRGLWAIDPNVFTGPDSELYLTWSCTDDQTGQMPQSLCIARMKDPLHVGSASVQISSPEEAWETRSGSIQEGPVGFVHGGATYVTYSASANWTANDYAVGVLVNPSGDLLNPSAWSKHGPILDGHARAYGPGSVVFINSPDDAELWGVYHAYDRLDCAQWACRSIRMQKVTWDAEGLPLMGYPMDPHVASWKPSGDMGSTAGWGDSRTGSQASGTWIHMDSSSAESSAGGPDLQQTFHAGLDSVAYTVSADIQTVGSTRYGIYVLYADRANHAEAFIDGKQGAFGSSATVNGVDQGTRLWPLPAGFDLSIPHAVRVVKTAAGEFSFLLDGIVLANRAIALDRGQIGIFTSGGNTQFRNVTVTDGSFGWGDAYGDAAEGLPGSPVAAGGSGYAQGQWNILDAKTVESTSLGEGWHTLYQGNPNLSSYAVSVKVQLSARGNRLNLRFGMVACHDDRNNQVSVWIEPETNTLSVNGVVHGSSTWQSVGLPAGFDPHEPHGLMVKKSGDSFTFFLDGSEMLHGMFNLANGTAGVATDDAQARFRAFTILDLP